MDIWDMGKRLLRIAVLVYIGFGAYLWWFQEDYIFHPNDQVFSECPAFAHTEEINHKGTRGYYHQTASATKLAVVYHGNAGSACDREYITPPLSMLGYSYLFVEYTGFSSDGNQPTAGGIMRNVEAIVDFVEASTTPAYESITVLGESLGSWPASYHTSIAKSHEPTLLLITPFDSIAAVAQSMYPVYPAKLLLRNEYDNTILADRAKHVCIIHGTNDSVVPMKHAQHLYDSLETSKEFHTIDGATHSNLFDSVPFHKALQSCLSTTTASSTSPNS